jgi:hypothetical protein
MTAGFSHFALHSCHILMMAVIIVAVIWLLSATGDRNVWQVRSTFVMQFALKWNRDMGNERWVKPSGMHYEGLSTVEVSGL